MRLDIGFVTLTTIGKDKPADRKQYVEYCLKYNKVFTINQDGVGQWARPLYQYKNQNDGFINSLDFPQNYGEVGTCCLLLYPDLGKMPFIIGSSDERNMYGLDEEEQIKLFKFSGEAGNSSYSGIDIRALKGFLSILSGSNLEGGGKITIKSENTKDNKAEINLMTNFINAIANIVTTKVTDQIEVILANYKENELITSIKYKLREGFTYLDEFENSVTANGERLNLSPKTLLEIGSANERLVLGNKLKELLGTFFDDLKSAYSALTVPVISVGIPSGTPINAALLAAKISAAKNKLDTMFSEYCKIQ